MQLAIRPEWWTPRTGHAQADGGQCVLTGRVLLLEHLGAETLVHVQVPGLDAPLVARLSPQQAEGMALAGTLSLAAAAQRVLVFDAEGKRVQTLPTNAIAQARYG